jgi:hypothetical protein
VSTIGHNDCIESTVVEPNEILQRQANRWKVLGEGVLDHSRRHLASHDERHFLRSPVRSNNSGNGTTAIPGGLSTRRPNALAKAQHATEIPKTDIR